jgi:ERCC4-type nuclease
MHINLTVDYREKKLIDCLAKRLGKCDNGNNQLDKNREELGLKPDNSSKSHVKWSEANLEVGDIQLSAVGDLGQIQAWLVIERKTHADMVASIKDGRYKEQKLRLSTAIKQAIYPARYMYILEGMQISSNEIPQLMGGWISTQFRDNIAMCRTISVEETAELVIRLAERMYKNFGELFPVSQVGNIPASEKEDTKKILVGTSSAEQQLDTADQANTVVDGTTKTIKIQNGNSNNKEAGEDNYLDALAGTIKTKKKDNLTPALCQQLMVCNIPGISSSLAVPIIQHFETLGKLIAYIHNPDITPDDKQKTIAAIKVQTSTGKTRTIGPVAAGKVLQYLA